MIAMPTIYIILYDRLNLNALGGSCYDIASSAIYNIIHRAFRRCQTKAPAEGFVRLCISYRVIIEQSFQYYRT